MKSKKYALKYIIYSIDISLAYIMSVCSQYDYYYSRYTMECSTEGKVGSVSGLQHSISSWARLVGLKTK